MAQFASNGRLVGERTPPTVRQQILAGVMRADYSTVKAPVLAVFARPVSPDSFPGCITDNDAVKVACRDLYEWTRRRLDNSEQSVRAIRSHRIVELSGANPFVFLSSEAAVRTAIDQFVEALPDMPCVTLIRTTRTRSVRAWAGWSQTWWTPRCPRTHF